MNRYRCIVALFGVMTITAFCDTVMDIRTSVATAESAGAITSNDLARIKEYGLPAAFTSSQSYSGLVGMISNHWNVALDDSVYYSSNQVAFLVMLSAGFHSGAGVYERMYARLLEIAATNSTACTRDNLEWFEDAVASPMENRIGLDYDSPVVSNALIRARTIYSNDTARSALYRRYQSGEFKREWDDERASGLPL